MDGQTPPRSTEALINRLHSHRTYGPILARTRTIHRPLAPVAFDCVKLIFVRHGSAVLLSEFGERPVTVGDVVVLGANTLCGSEPEGSITVTTLYLDGDYVTDQVFWRFAACLSDRWEARDFADELYSEPAQILHLGESRGGMLMPWLDELVAISLDGPSPARFFRMQSLLFAVLDVVTPPIRTTPVRQTATQLKTITAGLPHLRRFAPLRAEVCELAHAWVVRRNRPLAGLSVEPQPRVVDNLPSGAVHPLALAATLRRHDPNVSGIAVPVGVDGPVIDAVLKAPLGPIEIS